jgi:hypothetical protein
VKVKGSDGQGLEIPDFGGQGFSSSATVRSRNFFRPASSSRCASSCAALCAGEIGLRVESGAAGQPRGKDSDCATIHETDGDSSGMFTTVC